MSDPENIYMTNGASEAIKLCFKMITRNYQQGIMIPIPQYPMYSAQTTLDGATMVRYYLDEDKQWSVDANDIRQRIANAKDIGIEVRAIVVINPGNPTGNVLRRENIEDIIRVSHENGLLILADEVYQKNIYYPEEAPFISFRKVLHEMGPPYSDQVELVSMHSISKGMSGECGLRGGYFETHNLDKFASEMLYKIKSLEVCSNTVGQIATYLMVDPPKEGRESSECFERF